METFTPEQDVLLEQWLIDKNIKINIEKDGDLLYFKFRRGWFYKRYVQYLGILKGQTHSPLIFTKEKKPFININGLQDDFIEQIVGAVKKYLGVGGRIRHGWGVVGDWLAINGYADEQ